MAGEHCDENAKLFTNSSTCGLIQKPLTTNSYDSDEKLYPNDKYKYKQLCLQLWQWRIQQSPPTIKIRNGFFSLFDKQSPNALISQVITELSKSSEHRQAIYSIRLDFITFVCQHTMNSQYIKNTPATIQQHLVMMDTPNMASASSQLQVTPSSNRNLISTLGTIQPTT